MIMKKETKPKETPSKFKFFKRPPATGKKASRYYKNDMKNQAIEIAEEVGEYGGKVRDQQVEGLRKEKKSGKLSSKTRARYVALIRAYSKKDKSGL
jgi:hypothetical protein